MIVLILEGSDFGGNCSLYFSRNIGEVIFGCNRDIDYFNIVVNFIYVIVYGGIFFSIFVIVSFGVE